MLETFLLLIFMHAVTDGALQTGAMGQMKSRHFTTQHHKSGRITSCWWSFLSCHALVNGAGVYMVTGSFILAFAEAGVHWLIDFCSCEDWYPHYLDQVFHFSSKLLWAFLATRGVILF